MCGTVSCYHVNFARPENTELFVVLSLCMLFDLNSCHLALMISQLNEVLSLLWELLILFCLSLSREVTFEGAFVDLHLKSRAPIMIPEEGRKKGSGAFSLPIDEIV